MLKKLYKKIKYHLKPFYCPFCEGNWNQFEEHGFEFSILNDVKIIGGGKRKHVCPNCSSTDRLRMIYSYLLHNTDFLAPKEELKILHIAPERLLLELLSQNENIKYVAIDKFNFGGIIKYGDITELEFEDNYFDLIICNHVLEHIEEDEVAMSEIYRVLKFDGHAILQIPYSITIPESIENPNIVDPSLREKHFGQDDHVRIYSLDDFKRKLENLKFKIKFLSPFKEKWKYNPEKLGLNKRESILITIK